VALTAYIRAAAAALITTTAVALPMTWDLSWVIMAGTVETVHFAVM
jgi:hypothetical protein